MTNQKIQTTPIAACVGGALAVFAVIGLLFINTCQEAPVYADDLPWGRWQFCRNAHWFPMQLSDHGESVPFYDIDGHIIPSLYHYDGGITEKVGYEIQSEDRWAEVWQQFRNNPTHELPAIDFDKYTLLLAVSGRFYNGGHDLAFAGIYRVNNMEWCNGYWAVLIEGHQLGGITSTSPVNPAAYVLVELPKPAYVKFVFAPIVRIRGR